jgi:hypothetical protein
VVAIDEVLKQLIDGLEREKLTFDISAVVNTMLETSDGREPSLILLAHDEAVSGLLRSVAPVTRPFSHVELWEVRAALTAGRRALCTCRSRQCLWSMRSAVPSDQTRVPRTHARQIEPR